ncbi:MAG: biotin--protein ligase [Candidatus Aenigmarchaeota archaeon]|nr:biotin--protein ligase [Candidatus Aenigmarchaeota archaeon]
MPSAQSSYKVESGKLVKIKITFDEKIMDLQILGDFFLYPEESLKLIEKAIEGMDANSDENSISKIIEEAAQKNRIEMIGVNPQAIAKAIRMAIDSV